MNVLLDGLANLSDAHIAQRKQLGAITAVIMSGLLIIKKIKINRILSKRKYPIINLDYKNFKRREDIKIEFDK